jgi:hypothetical protein
MLLATLSEEAWAQAQPFLSPEAQAILDRAPAPEDWVSLRALVELSKAQTELGGPETSRARGSLMAEILHGDLPSGMRPKDFLVALPQIFQESFLGGRLEVALGPTGRADLVLHGHLPLPGLTEKAIPSCIFTSLKQAGAISVIVDHLPPASPVAPTRYQVRWF